MFSYCLMPNHIHFEIKQDSNIPLSKCIGGLHNSYVSYYKKKYNFIGHLFQGRFKLKEVKSEAQLIELMFYIHLNPVVAKLSIKPEEWIWSSAKDYSGVRSGNLCNKHPLKVIGEDDYKILMREKIEKVKWKHINDLILD